MSIVYPLTNKGACEALRGSFSHKQTISRYIASADLASVTAPGQQVWPVPCLPEVQLALPVKPAKATVSRQQARGPPVILDQWTHLPTHLSALLVTRARREEKRASEGERDSPWVVDELILNGWMGLNSLMQRDVIEADRLESGSCLGNND